MPVYMNSKEQFVSSLIPLVARAQDCDLIAILLK